MGPQGPWSWPYVENNKPVVTFFAKPDFSRFLICVINGSGVSFGQFAKLFEFFLHHMTALPVYVCLGFQASYNFEYQKMSTCISPRPSPLDPTLWIMVILEVPCTPTSIINPNLRQCCIF